MEVLNRDFVENLCVTNLNPISAKEATAPIGPAKQGASLSAFLAVMLFSLWFLMSSCC